MPICDETIATAADVEEVSATSSAGNFALNTGYAEYPAMRSRLLLGTAAWKYRSDAYLYYSMNGWKPVK